MVRLPTLTTKLNKRYYTSKPQNFNLNLLPTTLFILVPRMKKVFALNLEKYEKDISPRFCFCDGKI